MRGVSAKSLEAVLDAVDRTIDGGADANALGDELFGVVGVLDSQPALRRILTDPSTETSAQERLARQIIGDHVGQATIDVVGAAVSGRWSSARDLPDALERAGVTAHVAGADNAGALDDVEDELFRFGRVVAGDTELRSVLTDRSAPVDGKAKLVERLLRDKSRPASLSLARQAVAARSQGFEATLTAFAEIAAQRQRRLVATARVATDLDERDKQRLVDVLGRKYGRDVHVNVIVDPSVIGGVSVRIGEDVIDGTISGRLEDARRRIAG